ncbi:MAG: hypothetical protein LIP01_12720 [Tannerellaceae bacterium]|nr:hypothetical protein [Tannerellaceae bacterium]
MEWFFRIALFIPLCLLFILSIHSLVFNTNEWITRITGTPAKAVVTWNTERKNGRSKYGGRYTYYEDYATFHCFPSDTLKYEVYVGTHTSLSSKEAVYGREEVNVRVNKKGNKIAVENSRHTCKNIVLILLNSFFLLIGYKAAAGKLERPIEILSNKFPRKRKGRPSIK